MAASVTAIAPKTEEGGNFFSRMAWYYQMAILLGLVVVLSFAADMAFYTETRAQTVKIREQTDTLKVKNAQGETIRQNLLAAEATLKQKRAEIEGLRELLPDQAEISTVYDDIKDFMRQEKLELRRFMIGKTAPSDFYTAQPIDVEVSGSYDNVGQFFSSLGFFKRIVSVTDVQVKQAEDGAQLAGRSINSSFIVTAYYITPENLNKLTSKKPAAPAAGEKKKAGQPAKKPNAK
jgi:type IV pilus assembly protein PilO